MRVLLDTCVLTDLRHPQGNEAVKAAITAIPDGDLYLSALMVGEIARSVALLPDGRRKRTLNSWLVMLKSRFAERLLAVDLETTYLWGEITARVQQSGQTLPVVHGLVAATALRHGLRIMTRYPERFMATGVLIVNPWKELEWGN